MIALLSHSSSWNDLIIMKRSHHHETISSSWNDLIIMKRSHHHESIYAFFFQIPSLRAISVTTPFSIFRPPRQARKGTRAHHHNCNEPTPPWYWYEVDIQSQLVESQLVTSNAFRFGSIRMQVLRDDRWRSQRVSRRGQEHGQVRRHWIIHENTHEKKTSMFKLFSPSIKLLMSFDWIEWRLNIFMIIDWSNWFIHDRLYLNIIDCIWYHGRFYGLNIDIVLINNRLYFIFD